MSQPVVWWTITAVVFFILELTTASFFFLWIGAGAAITAVLSFFIDTEWIQYTCFALSSVLLVTISRRWAGRFSGATKRASNVDALVGQVATVTKVEKQNPCLGYVKVGGEAWRAESQNQKPLKVNMKVEVVVSKGNVLVVKV